MAESLKLSLIYLIVDSIKSYSELWSILIDLNRSFINRFWSKIGWKITMIEKSIIDFNDWLMNFKWSINQFFNAFLSGWEEFVQTTNSNNNDDNNNSIIILNLTKFTCALPPSWLDKYTNQDETATFPYLLHLQILLCVSLGYGDESWWYCHSKPNLCDRGGIALFEHPMEHKMTKQPNDPLQHYTEIEKAIQYIWKPKLWVIT